MLWIFRVTDVYDLFLSSTVAMTTHHHILPSRRVRYPELEARYELQETLGSGEERVKMCHINHIYSRCLLSILVGSAEVSRISVFSTEYTASLDFCHRDKSVDYHNIQQ